LEGTTAAAALPMAGKSVHANELLPTFARVWLDATMDLRMSLQIMRSHESLVTVDALVLPISKMGLHMRTNVLAALEALSTTPFEEAAEGICHRVVLDESCHLLT
jgi:hypothetical protein